jgi:uncharacterized protein YjbJ (UPF0337 family)
MFLVAANRVDCPESGTFPTTSSLKAAGKVKQGVGKAVGSEKLQSEGAPQEAKGDAQRLKRDAKNAVKGWCEQSDRWRK